MTLPKHKKRNEKSLKTKADNLHSIFIRRGAADIQGYVTCYCGVKIRWQDSDCSHYIPRGILALRYDTRNTAPSCKKCNRFMGGNIQAYSIYLESRYGSGILQELHKEKQKILRYFDYESIIAERKAQIKELDLKDNEKMQTM